MQVAARPLAQPGVALDGEVVALDSRIDPDTRTLRVRARLDNSEDRLRAGMAFSITLRFPGDTFAAVDPLAIQWSADGAYVWVEVDGRPNGCRCASSSATTTRCWWTARWRPGHVVVTEGVQMLRAGRAVPLRG